MAAFAIHVQNTSPATVVTVLTAESIVTKWTVLAIVPHFPRGESAIHAQRDMTEMELYVPSEYSWQLPVRLPSQNVMNSSVMETVPKPKLVLFAIHVRNTSKVTVLPVRTAGSNVPK